MTQDIDKLVARGRDEMHTFQRCSAQTCTELLDTIAAFAKRLEEAEAVIRPFATAAEYWPVFHDYQQITYRQNSLEVGHLRAAARWMEGK